MNKKIRFSLFFVLVMIIVFSLVFWTYLKGKAFVSNSSQVDETISLISPDGSKEVIRKDDGLSIINTATKKEILFLKDIRNNKGELASPWDGNESYWPEKWSPDSKKYLYKIQGWETYDVGLILFDDNNSYKINEENISVMIAHNCMSVTWSPDSTKAVFSLPPFDGPCSGPLFVINKDGSVNIKVLYPEKEAHVAGDTFQSVENVTWSKDGKVLTIDKLVGKYREGGLNYKTAKTQVESINVENF